MKELKYWDSWVEDGESQPYETVQTALEHADHMMAALQNLRPEKLKQIEQRIDEEIGYGLRRLLEDVYIRVEATPGQITVRFPGDFPIEKTLTLDDLVKEVREILAPMNNSEDIARADAHKEAWARALEVAATAIRLCKGAT